MKMFFVCHFNINPCHSLFFGRDHLRSNRGITCGPGSFAVQFGDHLRSGIICGRGSFAVGDHLRSWDHLRTRTVLLQTYFSLNQKIITINSSQSKSINPSKNVLKSSNSLKIPFDSKNPKKNADSCIYPYIFMNENSPTITSSYEGMLSKEKLQACKMSFK